MSLTVKKGAYIDKNICTFNLLNKYRLNTTYRLNTDLKLSYCGEHGSLCF